MKLAYSTQTIFFSVFCFVALLKTKPISLLWYHLCVCFALLNVFDVYSFYSFAFCHFFHLLLCPVRLCDAYVIKCILYKYIHVWGTRLFFLFRVHVELVHRAPLLNSIFIFILRLTFILVVCLI